MTCNTFTCVICGKTSEGYGHNPAPVTDRNRCRCCDRCEALVVLPARIERALQQAREQA
jgi:hypothetical protein